MNYLRYIYYKILNYKIFKKNSYYKRKTFEDRNVLEMIIIPYVLGYHQPKKILDIGREDYQSFYNEFFKDRELWTMDIDPKTKEFGSNNHITDSCTQVKKHFKDNYFDFVLMNGVMGWGLNKIDSIERAINGIYDIMNSNGIFIIGWNNFKDKEVIKPSDIKSLNKFKAIKCSPLKSHEFKCINGEHTYNFYQKK